MRSCFLMVLMALAAFVLILCLQPAQSASLSFIMPKPDKRFVFLRSPVASLGEQITEETLKPEDQETTEASEENNTSSGEYQEDVSEATTVSLESTTENETTREARREMEAQGTQESTEAVTVEAQETTTEQPIPSELRTVAVDTLATEESDIEAQTSTILPNPTDFGSQDQEIHALVETETETAKPDATTLSEAEDKTTEAQEIATNQTEFTETLKPEEA